MNQEKQKDSLSNEPSYEDFVIAKSDCENDILKLLIEFQEKYDLRIREVEMSKIKIEFGVANLVPDNITIVIE